MQLRSAYKLCEKYIVINIEDHLRENSLIKDIGQIV